MFRARKREFPVRLVRIEVNNQTTPAFRAAASSEPTFLRVAVTCLWVSTAQRGVH